MSRVEFPWELERINSIKSESGSSSSEVGSIKSEDHHRPKIISIVDDYLLVVVGKENKATVKWASRNSQGKKICILYIHIPGPTTVPYGRLVQEDTTSYRLQEEKKEIHKALDEYILICAKEKVNAQKLLIVAESNQSIEKAIIAFISNNMIGNVVMGAGAEPGIFEGRMIFNNRRNMQLTSKKAIYVHSQAPSFCRISFVCNGQIIHTREGVKPLDPTAPTAPTAPPIDEDHERSLGDELYEKYHKLMVEAENKAAEAIRKAKVMESLCNEEQKKREELQEKLANEMKETLGAIHRANEEQKQRKEEVKLAKETHDTTEAIQMAEEMESLCYQEQKQRKELEEKLGKNIEELEIIKNQHAKVSEELRVVLHQKSSLESDIEKTNVKVEELDEKVSSSIGLIDKYKKERDDLEMKLSNALLQTNPTTTQVSRFFVDFTRQEILKATDNFNPLTKIGEGGYGDTYKGRLRHVQVAIKVPSPDSMQGLQEFQQEVDALSKLRHPNIVTLIGVCSEASALVYEYLPNGNVDDRLECKDNITPPLSWQTRIRIAAELCSVLMFLHSSQPESIIHGDLKPTNVLLDASLSCKLSDFGICRKINNGEQSLDGFTRVYRTEVPKGTFAYMDPEFLITGELTPKSDIYAFGIILLRLLTGMPALGIAKAVQSALDKDQLNTVLDPSGGSWPFVQAKQLAVLGLRCSEMQRKNRPDLETDVFRVLESMRVSSGSSSLGRDDNENVPSYFMCPIFQEIMEDPHLAADGFTYEAEALKGWLDSGHDTSPMTNLQLENQTLIPNRVLRSAIQEWLQRRRLP